MNIDIEVNITAAPETNKLIENLGNFESIVIGVAREAIANSVLRAIESRFVARRDMMANYVENRETIDPSKITPKQTAQLQRVREALETAHGQRKLHFKRIIDLIVDSAHIQELRTADSITFNIGDVELLDTIDSPSATTIITSHTSDSPYTILWRQMEFGTGLFNKYPMSLTSTPYSSDKGWWYGPKTPYKGIHFKGTRPGNFLRTASGLPYTQDYQRFNKLFAQQLRQQLRG